mgnify:CR=1 FL=1
MLYSILTTVIDPSHSFRMTLNVPLTTPADPSRSLRITPFIPCHYDAFRSPLLVTPFPPIVILSGDKNALWERREAAI